MLCGFLLSISKGQEERNLLMFGCVPGLCFLPYSLDPCLDLTSESVQVVRVATMDECSEMGQKSSSSSLPNPGLVCLGLLGLCKSSGPLWVSLAILSPLKVELFGCTRSKKPYGCGSKSNRTGYAGHRFFEPQPYAGQPPFFCGKVKHIDVGIAGRLVGGRR